MSGLRTPPFQWCLLLMLVGMMVSASFVARTLRTEGGRYRRVSEQNARLRRLVADLEREQRGYAEAFGGNAPEPEDLPRSLNLEDRVRVVESRTRALTNGYRRRECRLEFERLEWEALRALLRETASSRPPWRVEEVEVETEVGGLRGGLALVALERPVSPAQ